MKMKKLVILIGILVMSVSFAKAQEVETAPVTGPAIEFEKTTHNYGDVPYNGNGECEFRFTNTGTEPLILQRPRSSCGCTVPSWPREPILPGESQVITVTYRTTKVGEIRKSITVTSNAVNQPTVTLYITGRVLEQVTETLPEMEPGVGTPVNNN